MIEQNSKKQSWGRSYLLFFIFLIIVKAPVKTEREIYEYKLIHRLMQMPVLLFYMFIIHCALVHT